jgi:hypothetical protein
MTVLPRYPVYIPTRSRWQKGRTLTIAALRKDGVPFRAVVVPSEADVYADAVGRDRLLVLPSDDYVLRDARNWIKDHATAEGYARHWQLDDNIREFRRLYKGRRIPAEAGLALRYCEDVTERYRGIAVSGLNYQMFVTPDTPPAFVNDRVYSCTLVANDAPYRWRLIYNDDVDLCLQAIAGGHFTLLVNIYMADKQQTMRIEGGNTNQLYAGDGRLVMARAIERAWPGVVKVTRKFGRPQHSINWKKFRRPLELLPESEWPVIDYEPRLVAKREVRSTALQQIRQEVNDRRQVADLDD